MYIKGYANTGKSTLADILVSNHQNIGTISAKEETFGLQSTYNKNLMYNCDVSKTFHLKFPSTDLQKITEGAIIDIPIKCKPSINNFKWITPSLWVSNYFLGYPDEQNSIKRRVQYWLIDTYLNSKDRDTSLPDKMYKQERHLILLKSVTQKTRI